MYLQPCHKLGKTVGKPWKTAGRPLEAIGSLSEDLRKQSEVHRKKSEDLQKTCHVATPAWKSSLYKELWSVWDLE